MNWQIMAEWLDAEWKDHQSRLGPTLHTGIVEGRSETADILAKCPAEWTAEQKLARLYEHLSQTFTRTGSPEEDQDDD